jgi:hypothetical protein
MPPWPVLVAGGVLWYLWSTRTPATPAAPLSAAAQAYMNQIASLWTAVGRGQMTSDQAMSSMQGILTTALSDPAVTPSEATALTKAVAG